MQKNAAITTAKRAAQGARANAHDAATNPWSVRVARCGYGAKGVVYLLIGGLAAKAATGSGGKTTDKTGAIETLYQQPFGRFLVAIVAVGLFAYALWLFIAAALDLERKGTEAKGVVARLAYVVVGFSYAALGFLALRLVLHRSSGGKSSDTKTQDWTARLLKHPGGVALVILAGLILLGIAGFFFSQAVTAHFRKKLDLSDAHAGERQWVVPVGRSGYAALGVVNAIIGLFLIIAAFRRNAGEAKGVGGALAELTLHPYGALLLGIVAVGLIAYGVYAFVEARYRRLVRA
ncbi:MAG: DUF1206 domain-containing protein [Thermomicrobiales bacterium]